MKRSTPSQDEIYPTRKWSELDDLLEGTDEDLAEIIQELDAQLPSFGELLQQLEHESDRASQKPCQFEVLA